MVKLFIYSLATIVLALLVTLYLGFPGDPGYLLIAFGNTTFETSLFALIVAVVIIYLLIRFIFLLWNWINPWQLVRAGRSFSQQRKAKGRSKSSEGLLSFARGSWHSAYNLLNTSSNDADASVVNHLAAAYSAFQLGDRESWIRQLDDAEMKYPAARSTINSLRAQLLFKSDQLEQCLAVLNQLRKKSLNDAPLLLLLKDVYVRLEDWEQLAELIPLLEKGKVVEAQELERIQIRVFVEQLYVAGKRDAADSRTDKTASGLSKLWKKAPLKYKEDEKIVKHYVELLMTVDARQEAVKAIEYALTKNWTDGLAQLYGARDYGCSSQQQIFAESWIKAKPASAALLLSLGRISMRNELWGKAKDYYEASIKIAPSADAYGELGRLLKHLGNTQASEINFNKYSALVGARLPELPMPSMMKEGIKVSS